MPVRHQDRLTQLFTGVLEGIRQSVGPARPTARSTVPADLCRETDHPAPELGQLGSGPRDDRALATPPGNAVRRFLVPTLAVLMLALAGCSEKSAGIAAGSEDPTAATTEETSSSMPSTTTYGGDSPLVDVAPCELLNPEGAATLKAGVGTEREVGEARSCRWHVSGATLIDSFTLDLALYDERGIRDVEGTNVVQKIIGSHHAVTFIDPTGLCVVSIAAGDSARVDTLATGGDARRGCELAARMAELVEPRLP